MREPRGSLSWSEWLQADDGDTVVSGSIAAVDLGAATGRVFVGSFAKGRLYVKPIIRFPNSPVSTKDGLHWDISALWDGTLTGLRLAAKENRDLASIGIDSWGADYALLQCGRLLGPPYHYRDNRSRDGLEAVHKLIAPDQLYRRNGLEALPFNSLYQLAADGRRGALDRADTLLFTPDLIGFWLTGRSATEPTIASTSGLLDARSLSWDVGLAKLLGLRAELLPPISDIGAELGSLMDPVAGLIDAARPLTVRKVASHDTASAIVGAPLQSSDAAYLSCGTWALLGVEVPAPIVTDRAREERFTNEVGLDGRILLQRNLMGLSLVNDLVDEVPGARLADVLRAAADVQLQPTQLIDPADPVFLQNHRVSHQMRAWLGDRGVAVPDGVPALVRCVLESLAQAFAEAVVLLERLTGKAIPSIHIVGGGSQNALLCQATADRSGRPVVAGPVEASVIGNILVQAREMSPLGSTLEDLREIVQASFSLKRYHPH